MGCSKQCLRRLRPVVSRRNISAAAVILVALIAVAAGCSGDPEKLDSDGPSTPSTTSASGVDEPGVAARAHTWGEKLQVAKVACLREAGWNANLDSDFSITGQVPPEQRSAFERDVTSCEDAYEREFPRPELTTADLAAMYERELATVECLERFGIPPSGSPISQQQYVQEMQTQGFTSWRAYDAVSPSSDEEFAELEEACPQPGASL